MHELDAASELLDLARKDNARLKKRLRLADARKDELVDAVYRAALEAANAAIRPTIKKPVVDRRRSNAEVGLLHVTDWQCGKHSPSFSVKILADRIELLASKVTKITNIQRADHPVDELVVMIGGDMVEGLQIFPGQVFEVEVSLYDQIFACARIIEQLLDEMLAAFPTVRVITEYGNHGRLGRKGEYPTADNSDRLVYGIVEARFANEKRITFRHSPEFFNTVTIGNYRALLVHGDEIGSAGGIVRKCSAWSSGVVPYDFRDIYLGHFHSAQTLALPNGGRVFVTGSPESANSYAAEVCAATSIPSQRLHFIDPARGRVTSEYTLWLDGI